MDRTGSLPQTLDEKKDEEVFQDLPLENQLDAVLRSDAQKRLRYIFLSENPEELVQRLPDLELYLTVKEVEEKDSIELVSLTTPEQFQYLLDLDFWKKDLLDPAKILHWMGILLECGEERIGQFVHSADPEFLTLLLKKFLHVTKQEGEPTETLNPSLFTLDQQYYVAFKRPEGRIVFQRFLEYLYHFDNENYRRILESLIFELESDLEETGYRLKKGRLADQGFPDLEEALEIYRFVNPDSVRGERKGSSQAGLQDLAKPSSTFYPAFQKEGTFFSSVLSQATDSSDQVRLRQELAALTNKAIIAEPVESFSPEDVRQVGARVFHYLNLGLKYISNQDETQASEFLRSLPLQKIFQCGVGATLLLKRKAEAILRGPWLGGDRDNLVFLDRPYLDIFEGVLKKRPALYRHGIQGDFKDLLDLREVEKSLELIETVVTTFEVEMKVGPQEIKNLDLSLCTPKGWREITLSTIFLTSLANQILHGTFRFEAIDGTRLRDLLSLVFERGEQGKGAVRMKVRKGIKEWIDSFESDEEKRQHLLAFSDFCCDLLEEEYGKIPEGGEIDPRFVKGLLVCHEGFPA